MFEMIAAFIALVVGGICIAFVALVGLSIALLLKVVLFPVTIVFDLVKYLVLLVVLPLILFVVIPIALCVIGSVIVAVLVAAILGLAIFGIPLMMLGS